jgi:hypothetical protein
LLRLLTGLIPARFPGHEIIQRVARAPDRERENGRVIKITERRERVRNYVKRIHHINDGGNDNHKRAFRNLAILAVRVSADQTQHGLKIRPRFNEWLAWHRFRLLRRVDKKRTQARRISNVGLCVLQRFREFGVDSLLQVRNGRTLFWLWTPGLGGSLFLRFSHRALIKALRVATEKPFVLNYLNCKIDNEPRASPAKSLMEDLPEEKRLQTVSFVVHATRGVIRDQGTRRKAMVILLGLALLLLISGFTFLQPALNPQEHPWRVIFFWIACIWFTFTALLIALFDLLVLRLQARRTERELRDKLKSAAPDSRSTK